jgi:Na+-transporting NADH:ubiquinone oxidoreductase subunit C
MNKKSAAYIIGFMIVICVVFGTGVSVVHNATQDMLEKNKRFHRNRIICRAFLLPVSGDTAKDYAEAISKHIRIKSITEDNRIRNVYWRIDLENPAIGYDFSGMGFWDRIDGIIVLTQDLEKIINIQFFDQKETPGLGARIEEKWFTDQFKGVPIAWEKDVSDRVIIGRATGAKPKNQVDAITGATQTSMALKRFLNAELERIRALNIDGVFGG